MRSVSDGRWVGVVEGALNRTRVNCRDATGCGWVEPCRFLSQTSPVSRPWSFSVTDFDNCQKPVCHLLLVLLLTFPSCRAVLVRFLLVTSENSFWLICVNANSVVSDCWHEVPPSRVVHLPPTAMTANLHPPIPLSAPLPFFPSPSFPSLPFPTLLPPPLPCPSFPSPSLRSRLFKSS